MDIAVITSSKDPASVNSYSAICELQQFKDSLQAQIGEHSITIHEIDEVPIHAENLDSTIKADAIIFLTKHTSGAGVQSLTVHPIGNFNDAPLGGKEKTLSPSPALLLKQLYLSLVKNNEIHGDVAIEATHHGPFLETPTVFLEIGSNEEQWKDPAAGKVIAKALIEALEMQLPEQRIAIGIGGPHYSSRFLSRVQERNIALSHVCSKHNLPYLTKELLQEAIDKSMPKADLIFIDKKGLGREKRRVLDIIEELDIENEKF